MLGEPYLLDLIEGAVCYIMGSVGINVCFSEIGCRWKYAEGHHLKQSREFLLKHDIMTHPRKTYHFQDRRVVNGDSSLLWFCVFNIQHSLYHCCRSCIILDKTLSHSLVLVLRSIRGAGQGQMGKQNCLLIDRCGHPIPLPLFLHTLVVSNLIWSLIECNLVKKGPLLIFPV